MRWLRLSGSSAFFGEAMRPWGVGPAKGLGARKGGPKGAGSTGSSKGPQRHHNCIYDNNGPYRDRGRRSDTARKFAGEASPEQPEDPRDSLGDRKSAGR